MKNQIDSANYYGVSIIADAKIQFVASPIYIDLVRWLCCPRSHIFQINSKSPLSHSLSQCWLQNN